MHTDVARPTPKLLNLFFTFKLGLPGSPREPQGAPGSPREPQEAQGAPGSLREPQGAPESPREPQGVSESPREASHKLEPRAAWLLQTFCKGHAARDSNKKEGEIATKGLDT